MRKANTIRAFELEVERLEGSEEALAVAFERALDHALSLRSDREEVISELFNAKNRLEAAK